MAVLVIPMPGGVRPPTDDAAAMIACLFRYGSGRSRRFDGHDAQPMAPAGELRAVQPAAELVIAARDDIDAGPKRRKTWRS